MNPIFAFVLLISLSFCHNYCIDQSIFFTLKVLALCVLQTLSTIYLLSFIQLMQFVMLSQTIVNSLSKNGKKYNGNMCLISKQIVDKQHCFYFFSSHIFLLFFINIYFLYMNKKKDLITYTLCFRLISNKPFMGILIYWIRWHCILCKIEYSILYEISLKN